MVLVWVLVECVGTEAGFSTAAAKCAASIEMTVFDFGW
jgi:hypothetical protein